MAVYINNLDMSVKDVYELLEIKEGTAKDWAEKDGWTKIRNEIKENIKNKMAETAEYKHTQVLLEVNTNLLEIMLEATLKLNLQLVTTKDIKDLSDTLKKNYEMLGMLKAIEAPATKVEHSGEVTQHHTVSEYERKLDKFSNMIDSLSKPKDGEENEE
jgi:hypothetical protein